MVRYTRPFFLFLGGIIATFFLEEPKSLVGAATAKEESVKERVKTIAIWIFEGVELLDFIGPAEVFIVAQEGRRFARSPWSKRRSGCGRWADGTRRNLPVRRPQADIVVVPVCGRSIHSAGDSSLPPTPLPALGFPSLFSPGEQHTPPDGREESGGVCPDSRTSRDLRLRRGRIRIFLV